MGDGVDIHPAAATGFARAARAYDRGRPGYPDDALDWLVPRLGPAVVDLGAGTGRLTGGLAARGLDVVAVEPVEEMRALIAVSERVRALAGTAEAIPLPDSSADAVTVAQAFHWFDVPRALAEIHRVLRPGGALAIVWNRRRMEDEIHERIDELLAPHRGDVPAHATDGWRPLFDASELFVPAARRDFDNEQLLDGDGLVDRFGSVSFVAALDDAARDEVHAALRALAGRSRVALRYRTGVEIARRADA